MRITHYYQNLGIHWFLLHITVPASMVDINVHPRKSEVKFEDDKIIFKAVYHAILNALNNPLHERYERESSSFTQPLETESQGSGYNSYQLHKF